ncbi:hypothetical protein [Plesiomonas sp.]|uniref:hypothetical protein n=1 Tax=Plesiomonas sp. TaxID=2486279 RepID=UPI003F323A2B
MGTLKIVNALGVDVTIVQAIPYNFSPSVIRNGESATAQVQDEFEGFKLKIVTSNGNKYFYDLNKGHWYEGDGPNHYPNPSSKVNIILRGDRGSYIETNYNYAPNDEYAICQYSGDSKALDKTNE